MNPYETGISILTAPPGTAENAAGKDALDETMEQTKPWWQWALRSRAGREVLAVLKIPPDPHSILPAEWQAHPLVEPDDRRPEFALPVTVSALRAALAAQAGVMFLERRANTPGPHGRRNELHLCAIDAAGTRAALMPVC